MLITRETDYALRILRAISSGAHFTVGEICQKELLPQQFVYKILKKIEQAGLVRISRGALGGCELIGDLKSTTLYDLISMLDAEHAISGCVKDGHRCEWVTRNAKPCSVHARLLRIQEVLDAELRGCSLHELIFGTGQ
jgi:Rrf2 family protein